MKQIQIQVFVCIDEHGNYHAVGSNNITEENKHSAIAIIEEGIKLEGIAVNTTSFKVQIQLPEQE